MGGHAGHLKAAGEEKGPVVDIFLGIAEILALARRSAAGMNPDDFFKRYAPQGEGIAFPQVFGRGKGQALQIFQLSNVFRRHTGSIELLAVLVRAAVGMGCGPLQSLELVGAELFKGLERRHDGRVGTHPFLLCYVR